MMGHVWATSALSCMAPTPGSKARKHPLTCTFTRAGDRGRTGDLYLGKVALYQLSHARNCFSLLDSKDPNPTEFLD